MRLKTLKKRVEKAIAEHGGDTQIVFEGYEQWDMDLIPRTYDTLTITKSRFEGKLVGRGSGKVIRD